jgi:hypothetical protein
VSGYDRAPREVSVTQRDDIVTSARGEVARRGGGKEIDDIGLMRISLGRKMKKIHVVISAAINGQLRFKAMIS